MMRPETDALIVGGGPAGSALAIHLARRGRSVDLIEQSRSAHHKVCGEFLSCEAVQYLGELGVDLCALGARPIHGMRLAGRTCAAQCELPFPAMSLSRSRLDEALLSLAAQSGAGVLRGQRVNALNLYGDAWKAKLVDGTEHRAANAFLATGKHDLGGHRRPPGRQNNLIAFKMYFRLGPSQQRELEGWVDLVVFPGGYAGLLLDEDGAANLCLVLTRKTLQRCEEGWGSVFATLRRASDHLAQRLEGAQPIFAKPLALSSIPYGMLIRRAEPGLWRLGDQAAVIPSFAGDGISIALHSAQLAAGLYQEGGTSAQCAGQLARELNRSIRLATALSRLMVSAPGLIHLSRAWPPLLRYFAMRTRVPRDAMRLQKFIEA